MADAEAPVTDSVAVIATPVDDSSEVLQKSVFT
ncbi:hypothetical protein HCH_03635 [Hahella chejuensis KCTC 2396]|uniref:Uncharacterized protein n=1 Tax=Hahella chejuensis (strain KCTC 2396) TaxID=349521 RepID=Q2SG49_HAHCH|nr:hypothetical protein HCH_03635 [Hahella chejuensis KCTC 2396]